MSTPAEELLSELRASGSGLASFVEHANRRRRPWIVLSSAAVRAWERREPAAWAKVEAWLETENIPVIRV